MRDVIGRGCTVLIVMLLVAGCRDEERTCYETGACECMEKTHCPEDEDCIDGSCSRLIPPPPPKREFGEPCVRDRDCVSGLCLPRGPGNGGVCTRTCEEAEEACPEGWICKTHLPEDGSGAIALCVQEIAENKLCRSCSVSTQCNAIGDLCVELTSDFVCATDCSLDPEGCPPGYACSQIEVSGGTASQCLPAGGSCDCTEATVGLTRPCTQSNEHGACYGLQVCEWSTPGGQVDWADCDAPAPEREVCNGADDDCDGLTDSEDPSVDTDELPTDPPYPACRKGSALGDCIGAWTCQLGDDGDYGWSCAATDPENEICNGRDDNCDGVADDPFIDEQGRYVDAEHCGGCGGDCGEILPHLARDDAGEIAPGAMACRLRAEVPVCVPLLCEPGFYPFPEELPVTCALLVSPACQPCTQNADCRISSDLCVIVGEDPGSYCAQSCDPASPYAGCTGQVGVRSCCPEGYTCEQAASGLLCQPAADSCTCNPERLDTTRSCLLVGGGEEVCQGAQICEQAGPDAYAWSDCQPASVVVEVCDYLDNNCDGQVDEGFVNPQGIYDTDEHCGACNENCIARWDPEIQHAIGGCVGSATDMACRIVACTTETVVARGPCQSHAACDPGFVCDPQTHHCISTDPDECGDSCGTPCQSSQVCRQAHGPAYSCSDALGFCQVEFQFEDLNAEDTDGCECPAAVGDDPDEPDVAETYPEAGIAYVDRDCDGIDGQLDRSLFVWSGSDQSLGTREHPYATITEALAAFAPGQHDSILVAAGTYRENVVLSQGARLFGGYAYDFSVRDVVLFPTVVQGNEPAASAPPGSVNAEGIRGQRTVLAGFTILGYDVNSDPPPGQPGQNSYAVYIRDSDASLEILNNNIIGSRGGDGVDGAPGVSGQNGASGSVGQDSFECPASDDCQGFDRAGGAGGVNGACPGAAGNAGAMAKDYYLADPQDYGAGGFNGTGGYNSIYGGSPDPSLCKYDCQVSGMGSSNNGGDAYPGQEGPAGTGGAACAGTGLIQNGHWRPRPGSAGGAGTRGNGGGGGGAGGAVLNNNAFSGCTQGDPFGDLGASGGGGGAGGCGATGGTAGSGGGGSFGIFMDFVTPPGSLPIIRGNRIRLGYGGLGGRGGGGGQGGLGGQGGDGGDTVLPAWCAGAGGRGGRGGDGGAGGGGGGGCGGASFGIATTQADSAADPSIRDNQFESPGGAYLGGPGGRGGPSPAGAGYAGSDGTDGESGDLKVF